MDIQTRPISDLPEMSKDSQTAQLMVYDEADQTPKRMPRSVMPVLIVAKLDAPGGDILKSTIISVSHTPDEVRSLLKSDALVSAVFNITASDMPMFNVSAYGIVTYQPENTERYGFLSFAAIIKPPAVIHAMDGSNVWVVGEPPEKSSN